MASAAADDEGPLPEAVLQQLQDSPPRLVFFDLETTGECTMACHAVRIPFDLQTGSTHPQLPGVNPLCACCRPTD